MTSRNPWDGVLRRRLSPASSAGRRSCRWGSVGGGEAQPSKPTSSPTTGGQLVPVKTRGGVYRCFSYSAMPLDTYDPHQTQFGPLYNMHSAVFSRLQPWFGYLYVHLPNIWLDSTHPTSAGRSA